MSIEKSSAIRRVEADFDDGFIGYYLQVNEKYYNPENGSLMIKRIATNSHFTEIEKFRLELYFHSINHNTYQVYENTIIVKP
jgi:hypothetical protein